MRAAVFKPTPACAVRAPHSRRPTVVARAERAAVAAGGRDPTGLSSLRVTKPSESEMQNLMASWTGRSCNHSHAGLSITAPDLPEEVKKGGYMLTTTRRKVGSGKQVYDNVVKMIKAWQHLQLGWNCTTTPNMKQGTTICSATQTIVPWSVLPAQVTYMSEGPAEFGAGDKGRRFALGLSSLNGHQLAGEERFQVELHADGSVWYDVYLFSKPDTLLALVSLPVVKLMQMRYVNDSAKVVAAAMQA